MSESFKGLGQVDVDGVVYVMGLLRLWDNGVLASDDVVGKVRQRLSSDPLLESVVAQVQLLEKISSTTPKGHEGVVDEVENELTEFLIQKGFINHKAGGVSYAYSRFQVYGPELDPDWVTQLLKLPPDWELRPTQPYFVRNQRGNIIDGRNLYFGGHWHLDSSKWLACGVGTSLDIHLQWVLEQLEGKCDEIQKIFSSGAHAVILCVSDGWDETQDEISEEQSFAAQKLGLAVDVMPYEFGIG